MCLNADADVAFILVTNCGIQHRQLYNAPSWVSVFPAAFDVHRLIGPRFPSQSVRI